jgi:parallel beta-helix repeat protein
VAATPIPTTEHGRHVLRVGPGRAYATIQDAVNAAAPGSRILVDPGTYREMVLVRTSNLQILAQGPGTLVVPAKWDPYPPPGHLWGGVAFTVFADHVTIQGFDIEYALSSAEQGRTCQFAIYFEGSHNVIADNYMFARPGGGCPGITPVSSTPLAGGSDFNTIERNVINGADVGILIGASEPDAVNVGNVIRDNLLFGVFQAPISITNGAWFEVSGNHIAGTNGGPCIVIGADTNEVEQGHHTVRDNVMRSCAGNGITLYANPGTTVAHNRIVGNRIHRVAADGIQLWTDEGSTLSGNEVASNSVSLASGNGIFLSEGASGNRILGNEVGPGNSVGVRVDGDGNLIAGNCVYRSVLADVTDLGTGNRWVNNRCTPGGR